MAELKREIMAKRIEFLDKEIAVRGCTEVYELKYADYTGLHREEDGTIIINDNGTRQRMRVLHQGTSLEGGESNMLLFCALPVDGKSRVSARYAVGSVDSSEYPCVVDIEDFAEREKAEAYREELIRDRYDVTEVVAFFVAYEQEERYRG